jgi:hypothetical protein
VAPKASLPFRYRPSKNAGKSGKTSLKYRESRHLLIGLKLKSTELWLAAFIQDKFGFNTISGMLVHVALCEGDTLAPLEAIFAYRLMAANFSAFFPVLGDEKWARGGIVSPASAADDSRGLC